MSGNGTMGAKQDASDLPPFEVGTIADAFRLSTLDPNPPEWLPATSLPDIQNVGDVPLDKWVFGQFSKFFLPKHLAEPSLTLRLSNPRDSIWSRFQRKWQRSHRRLLITLV